MEWYQPYFCEENAWQALKHDLLDVPCQWVVFLSNPARACALWAQSAAPVRGEPVFWDYHVVVMGRDEQGGRWIYDPDHVPGTTRTLEQWWGATFPMMAQVRASYRPWCRVVERDVFLKRFYSDRGHMKDAHGGWLKPPPPWPPLLGGDVGVMAWVDMVSDTIGQVFDAQGFERAYL